MAIWLKGGKIMSITGVKVKLVGEDGNAFSILGRVSAAMRRAGVERKIIQEYQNKATSGDYNNLLMVTLEYVDEEGMEDTYNELCEEGERTAETNG